MSSSNVAVTTDTVVPKQLILLRNTTTTTTNEWSSVLSILPSLGNYIESLKQPNYTLRYSSNNVPFDIYIPRINTDAYNLSFMILNGTTKELHNNLDNVSDKRCRIKNFINQTAYGFILVILPDNIDEYNKWQIELYDYIYHISDKRNSHITVIPIQGPTPSASISFGTDSNDISSIIPSLWDTILRLSRTFTKSRRLRIEEHFQEEDKLCLNDSNVFVNALETIIKNNPVLNSMFDSDRRSMDTIHNHPTRSTNNITVSSLTTAQYLLDAFRKYRWDRSNGEKETRNNILSNTTTSTYN